MIVIRNIEKSYDGERVLKGISFELEHRETLSILGKSGCGKSTLLKVLAGLEQADKGSFTVNDEDVFSLPAESRAVVYLSQEALLFPHLDVFSNLSFGLNIRKIPSDEIKKKVLNLADKLGLEEHLQKMPSQLSGGQKQRVNFGRALIINPKIMLLDEPFGSLDAHTRVEMQALFKEVKEEYKITALFVTHDLKEALKMGDKIAQMSEGILNIFDSVQAFIRSPLSGADEEISFWKNFDYNE